MISKNNLQKLETFKIDIIYKDLFDERISFFSKFDYEFLIIRNIFFLMSSNLLSPSIELIKF